MSALAARFGAMQIDHIGMGLLRGQIKVIDVQMALHKSELVRRYEQAKRPRYVVDYRKERQYAQPEPHEYINDLVEEVYTQHTLHRPVVRVANLAYLKVTVGDAREMSQLVPFLTAEKHLDDFDAERVIVIADEAIQQEELTHRIGQPQCLDKHVEYD